MSLYSVAMRRIVISGAVLAALLCVDAHAATRSVLFIGNSFLFGYGSPVRYYRSHTVTDLNGEGQGGVPALFKSFTQQAGLDFDVSLETRGGSGLDFHLAEKLTQIGSKPWDAVVMHGFSLLDAQKPRDPQKLTATSKQMADFLRGKNADVDIFLIATWARADQVYPDKGAWHDGGIEVMTRDLRAAYDQAAKRAAIKTIIPVGESWLRAMQAGVADANPYDGIEANKLNLWTYDAYHASTFGYYLQALVVFGSVTGVDPRSLGPLECSAFELGLSPGEAKSLQQVAFDQLSATMPVAPAPKNVAARSQAQRCVS